MRPETQRRARRHRQWCEENAEAIRARPLLTPQQWEIAALVANGHSAKAIGDRLGLSARTVYYSCQAIYTRLGLRDGLHSPRKMLALWWHERQQARPVQR